MASVGASLLANRALQGASPFAHAGSLAGKLLQGPDTSHTPDEVMGQLAGEQGLARYVTVTHARSLASKLLQGPDTCRARDGAYGA